MQYTLNQFNTLAKDSAQELLFNCCGSTKWTEGMVAGIPYSDEQALFDLAKSLWYDDCKEADVMEAFSHHPKIGDKSNLREKFASTSDWAKNEQAGVNDAAEETLEKLAKDNEIYFDKNGYIFLICATGKSAAEMSALLSQRLMHSREEEMAIAKSEQFKITLLRLKKALDLKRKLWNQVSQVTTHVLDTSKGMPGKDITIRLKRKTAVGFEVVAMGITNADGRVANLLPAGVNLAVGHYQMCFDTGAYFEANKITGFYPKVDIDFNTFDESHYHVPLLINPFGYSTYRGS